MMRRALAAWLALTAAEVAAQSPTKSSLSNSTTTTIDPWSPLLGDTEGAPTVTEPSPGRRRGEQSLVESIRSQLMHDNYDYIGKGSAELIQTPRTNVGRGIQRRMSIIVPTSKGSKAFEVDEENQAYDASPQYKALMDEQFALTQAIRRKSTEYTVTVTEKDLLYYLDDNYLRYKYLVSEIPFGRRSYNNTVNVNSRGHQTQASIKRTDKQNKIKNQEYRKKSIADVNIMKHGQQKNIKQIIATNSTLNNDVNGQRDEWKSEPIDENKNISIKNDYSNEFFWDGNNNVSEKSQQTVNRRMYYKRPPNDEIDDIRRYRRKKLKQFSSYSHKNKALRNAILRDKANFRRNKMYSEQNKVRQESQKYIQQLRKYKQQRHKKRKHISQLTPYQLKTKMRQHHNMWHQRQHLSNGPSRVQRRRRNQKNYRGHVQPDRIQDTTDEEDENVSETYNPSNNELAPDQQEDKQDLSHHQDEQNGSLSEEDEYKDGQPNDQQMNKIQGNIDKDDDETDGSWKQAEKKRYVSNSLEHDIRTGKLIVGNRRMDTPLNDTQPELNDTKYEDGLNETQYDDIEDGDENQLKDGQNYTTFKDNTTSTPSAKYKLIKVKSAGSRRSQKGERQFLQERRADGGVALIALDDGPFPQFRLPLSRRQYMFESHHKHNPLKDQLPKAARLSHNQLN